MQRMIDHIFQNLFSTYIIFLSMKGLSINKSPQ
jgi:hypothetical protein